MKTIKRPYPHFKYPNEIFIEYSLMSETDCKWHNVPLGSYEMRCKNYGWFPTSAIMGVDKTGKYTDNKGIGATISGNLGSAGIAVLNIKKAIELLKNEGYNI